ncbi:MAG: glycosyltransferase [Rhizobiales bacterium]|nr:glycosyltransferase [Hyphomicrobiales bacterium]
MITAILSTRDDQMGLALALSALVPAATDGTIRQAIVVDGGSRDGTLMVADEAGCEVLPDDDGEGLRRAGEMARSDWLLFLTPAAVLESGWQNEVLAFIDRAVMAGEGRRRAAAFRLGRVEGGFAARFAEGAAMLRSGLLAAPYACQGLLIPKSLYQSLGGHRPLPAMADVDLARRIGRRRLWMLRSRAFVRDRAHRPGFGGALRNAACLALFLMRLPPRVIGRLAS